MTALLKLCWARHMVLISGLGLNDGLLRGCVWASLCCMASWSFRGITSCAGYLPNNLHVFDYYIRLGFSLGMNRWLISYTLVSRQTRLVTSVEPYHFNSPSFSGK
jgi:hypothetical protein